ncbi:MAG TPA: hypothetical protein VJH03_11125 [Blastocatellia bacterium]|nr:hypothetical protein [Blastocatellia bacterium]
MTTQRPSRTFFVFAFIAIVSLSARIEARPQSPNCPQIFPDAPVVVAPNQPEVPPRSTRGMINALCGVKLDFVGCGFMPTAITLACDTNGDGTPELSIPLSGVTLVNRLLVQATLPALGVQLPGTAFPLACCGGTASIVLSRTIGPGDDNIFGPVTLTQTCQIDLGPRAPVVISASPSDADCSRAQNILIPGACFILPGGASNVTSVFAVNLADPGETIAASRFVLLSPNLIDALFDFGPASAGKTFLIYASGPNGTSRNLTAPPAGAPAGCPLGNEQGVMVTVRCSSNPGGPNPPAAELPAITFCRLDRSSSGSFTLTIGSNGVSDGSTVTVGGKQPKKVRFKDLDPASGKYRTVTARGRVCAGLPGFIVVKAPDGTPLPLFHCELSCNSQ